MALYPCAVGSHRYAGRQQAAYLGIANGSITTREKQRLCSVHFAELHEWVNTHLELIAIGELSQIGDDEPLQSCCGKSRTEDSFAIYAMLWPLGQEQHQYAAVRCAEHVGLFAEKAGLTL